MALLCFLELVEAFLVRNYKPGKALSKASAAGFSHSMSKADVWTRRRLSRSLVKLSNKPSGYFVIFCNLCGVTRIFSGHVSLANTWHSMGSNFIFLFLLFYLFSAIQARIPEYNYNILLITNGSDRFPQTLRSKWKSLFFFYLGYIFFFYSVKSVPDMNDNLILFTQWYGLFNTFYWLHTKVKVSCQFAVTLRLVRVL